MGNIHYNIGLIQQDLNNGSEALGAYQTALAYREKLAKASPDQLPSLLKACDKISKMIYYEDNPQNITQQLERIKTSISNLGNTSPLEKEKALAEINLIIGETYNTYDNEKSRPYFEAAVEQYTHLEKSETKFNALNQAFAHLQLGIVEKQDKEYKAAASQYHRALYLFQNTLKEQETLYFKVRVSNCYAGLIQVLLSDEKQEEVANYFPKYLDDLKKWVTEHPDEFMLVYCDKLNRYGLFLSNHGDPQKALDHLSEAKRLIKARVEENPDKYLEIYNSYNDDLIYALWRQGDYDLTMMMLEQKFAFNRDYIGQSETATVAALATLIDQIELNIETYQKQPEAAARKAIKLDPEGEWVNTNLAHALLFQKKWAEAQALYLEFAEQAFEPGKSFRAVFLEDLQAMQTAGLPAEDIEKVRALLKKQ